MLPSILRDPSLRCTAHSRRSGWKRCGRLACTSTGLTVCWTHGGARKKNRWETNAPNFKHGKRSLQSIMTDSHSIQRVKLLALGVQAINGSDEAGKIFDQAWPILMEKQAAELEKLATIKLGRKALRPRRKRAP